MTAEKYQVGLAFYTPSNRLSRLICWASRSRFCHVGVALGARFFESQAGGLRVSPSPERLVAAAAVVWLDCDPQDYQEALTYAALQTGKGYDYIGFISIAVALVLRRLGIPWRLIVTEDGTSFCSTFAAEVLERLGYSTKRDSRLTDPGDLARQFHAEGA